MRNKKENKGECFYLKIIIFWQFLAFVSSQVSPIIPNKRQTSEFQASVTPNMDNDYIGLHESSFISWKKTFRFFVAFSLFISTLDERTGA